MNKIIDWKSIDTVFLDMDGTLLDLYFDNYFWKEYLPDFWGKKNNMNGQDARHVLLPRFRDMEGTLSWYCVDYWSDQLEINIMELKSEIEHLINPRPYAIDFLLFVTSLDKHLVMVTNAHQDLINMKLNKTGIGVHFKEIISAHDYGSPKEDIDFWYNLESSLVFDKRTTLLIDDNQTVLDTARQFGISNLLAIAKPDSQAPERKITEYDALHDFRDLM